VVARGAPRQALAAGADPAYSAGSALIHQGPSSMPESLDRKIAEWREADSRARDVESSLSRILFVRLKEAPQTDTLQTQARLLRQLADEKLKAAIAALRPKR
jgi:hypothetical protein